MLRFATDTGTTQPIRLLYSARTPDELVFRKELDDIAASRPQTRVHYSITRPGTSTWPWAGRVGRIDAEWISETAKALESPKFYVAGLPEMVAEIVDALQSQLAIPEPDIDYEVFRGF